MDSASFSFCLPYMHSMKAMVMSPNFQIQGENQTPWNVSGMSPFWANSQAKEKGAAPLLATSTSIIRCRDKSWHQIALMVQQSLLTIMNPSPFQRVLLHQQAKKIRPQDQIPPVCEHATSVRSSPCDTGYVLKLHIHRLKSSSDISKELNMSSNHGFPYIYWAIVTEFKQIISHTVLNGPWSAYMLSIWGCDGDPPAAPDQIAHNLLRPSPTDALGPNTMPADGLSSIETHLNALQLISSPSSSLTHYSLVSKPPGEVTQRKCLPSEPTNGFLFPVP